MTSIRDYYRNRMKWYLINPLLIIIVILIAYFALIKPRYEENLKYLYDNRQALYDEYYAEAKKEVRKLNKEEQEDDSEKFWVVDKDKVNEEFEKHIDGKKERERVFFLFGSIFILFLSFPITTSIVRQPLYCKHCLKTVLPKSIVPFECPFCHTENRSFSSLYTSCAEPACKSIIPSVPCPHCKKQIDLLGEYDIEKIKLKRYGKKI